MSPLAPTAIGGVEATHAAQFRDPDVADRAYIAAMVYHVVKRYFAHAEALPAGYDFEARYRAYLAEAIAAPDRKDFSLATMRLFASLRNGHTSFNDEELRQQAGTIPFTIMRIDGRWTVVRSRMPELHPSDVVTMIDDKPADDWLEPIREHIGPSSQTALDRATWLRPFLFPRHFTIGTDDGRQVPVDLNASYSGPERGFTLAKEVETVRRPDGLVVIRIPSFADPKYEQAAIAAIQAAGDARAILLDLRDNTGGSSPGKLLSAIMTTPYQGTLVATPMTIAMNDASNSFNGGISALPTTMMRYGPDRADQLPDAWKGKIALLVDGGCASACEDFVLRFKDGNRGLVLGEPTFGSTGQPYFVQFPEFGMSFRVSTKREYFPDGGQFEGVGIQPDKSIPISREELRSGIDTQLELAAKAVLTP
ncbi:carboxyl-terminal processing protease [Rhizobium sp. BK313]|uniref:S41 family peptidase n=1 Tax=Rhizobium sp. BK313 TaxID=2587081 RepID=UPI0010D269B8|nr:S41 family peptidase [Rhizobium sp. BK313]MBB3455031.1 carboxyl-terminal processing protease [Rhizobium sp. BK313]